MPDPLVTAAGSSSATLSSPSAGGGFRGEGILGHHLGGEGGVLGHHLGGEGGVLGHQLGGEGGVLGHHLGGEGVLRHREP